MSKIKIIQPNRQSARQPRQFEPARLPDEVLYCLFATVTASDGYPIGTWYAVTFPDLQVLKLPVTGFQPVWRLVSMLPQAEPGTIEDLQTVLTATHKVMSADRQSRQ